jgi:hypothetical protein
MQRVNSVLSLLPLATLVVTFSTVPGTLAPSRPQPLAPAPIADRSPVRFTPAAVTIPPAPRPNDPPKPKKPGIQRNQA